MQKRARHWRGARLRLSRGSSKSALRIVTACLSVTGLNGSFSQWVPCVSVRTCSTVPVTGKKSAHEGAGRDQAPRLWVIRSSVPFECTEGDRSNEIRARHAPGRAAVFFASFLFGGLKRKEGGGRSARGLCSYPLKVGLFKTRGFRPPTATYSFAGPKEYAEKGLPLAWSTPARISGVIRSGTADCNDLPFLTGDKRGLRAMGLQRQVTPRQCSSRFGKKPPCPRGPEEIRPPAFHAPGRAAVFFASFLFGGLKRKEGGVRGAAPAV
jgi:hypothetical protein